MGTGDVNVALIYASATIVAALLTLAGIMVSVLRSRPVPGKAPDGPTTLPHPSKFDGTQVEFLELVVRRHNELDAKYTTLDATFEAEKQRREKYEGAVARYMRKLYESWPGPGKMPAPDDEDSAILDESLPWSRKSKGARRLIIPPGR